MADGISIRRFRDSDLDQLARLISETIGISYAGVYPPRAVPVNLKNRLRYIETDRANLAHGRLPSVVRFDATTLWHFDAAEWAPSTASSADLARTSRYGPLCRAEL